MKKSLKLSISKAGGYITDMEDNITLRRLKRLKKCRKSYIQARLAGMDWKLSIIDQLCADNPVALQVSRSEIIQETLDACEAAIRHQIIPQTYGKKARVYNIG